MVTFEYVGKHAPMFFLFPPYLPNMLCASFLFALICLTFVNLRFSLSDVSLYEAFTLLIVCIETFAF